MKLRNGTSHALTRRKSQQGIWGGRQRVLVTLYGKNGTKKTPKRPTKTVEKQKVRSSKPILLHSSLCTVHSVLTLGIACKIIH